MVLSRGLFPLYALLFGTVHMLSGHAIGIDDLVCSPLGGDVTAGDQWVTLGYDRLSATSTVLS